MARHVRLSAHGVLIALLASLVVAVTGSTAHAADRDCGDFGSQRSAQLFFLAHGGPARDPHRLDADHDGIACETNGAPYYFKKRLPDAGPPPAVRSTVTLSTRPRAAIAGERLALRVSVSPRAKRTVVIQRRVSSGWDRVVSLTTSKRGRSTFDDRVRASSTTYRAVVSAERVGNKRYLADVSPRRRVETQSQSVVLSLPRSAVPGESIAPVADAAPARRGREVELQRRKRGRWVVVDTARESRRGLVEFHASAGKKPGKKTFRAVVRAARGAEAVASDRERVRVKDPAPTDTTPPPVPTGVLAAAGNAAVHLSWSPVAASDLSTYVVHRQEPDGTWTEVERTPAVDSDVTGLTNGVAYTFAVSAVDIAGKESARSASVTVTPVAPDTTPPAAPAGLTAVPGDAQVRVSWTAVTAPDLAAYRLHVRETGATGWTRSGATGPSQTAEGLTNGTTYDFAVSAVDQVGNESALSEVVSATPVAPPLAVPTGLGAVPGDGQVELDWDDVADPRVIGYRIDTRDDAGGWIPTENGITSRSNGTVTGLVNGVQHVFSVVALAADGSESARSEPVTATPEHTAP